MKKYIVTGATGHVCNNIVRALIDKEYSVKILIRNFNDPAISNLNVEKVIGDINDLDFLKKVIEPDSIVIHGAGIIDLTNKQHDLVYKVNVEGTKNIVEACKLNKVAKLIYIGSTDSFSKISNDLPIKETKRFCEYDLKGDYATSKAIASNYVLDAIEEGLNATILCPSAVIGPNDYKVSNIGQVLLDRINHKPLARIKGGYNFIDARDVADAVIKASKCDTKPVYLLTGNNISVDELFYIIDEKLGYRHHPMKLPLWFVYIFMDASLVYYKLKKKKPVFTKKTLKTLNENHNFDNSLAVKDLDLSIRSTKESFNDAIEWFLQRK